MVTGCKGCLRTFHKLLISIKCRSPIADVEILSNAESREVCSIVSGLRAEALLSPLGTVFGILCTWPLAVSSWKGRPSYKYI